MDHSRRLDGLPPFLADRLRIPDTTLPEVRDLRKFVRRLPGLRTIRWTGRGGKGDWLLSKKSTLVGVEFIHSALLTRDIWEQCQHSAPSLHLEDVAPSLENILELPSTPCSADLSDVPSLTRTPTTSSSSRWGAQTPASQSPLSSGTNRRQSLPTRTAPMPSKNWDDVAVDIGDLFIGQASGQSPGSKSVRANSTRLASSQRMSTSKSTQSSTTQALRVDISEKSPSPKTPRTPSRVQGPHATESPSSAKSPPSKPSSTPKKDMHSPVEGRASGPVSPSSSPRSVPDSGVPDNNRTKPDRPSSKSNATISKSNIKARTSVGEVSNSLESQKSSVAAQGGKRKGKK